MEEIWKDIKGYEGLYQVSNLGRVKSLDRYVNYKNKSKAVRKGVIRKAKIGKGYFLINLSKDGVKRFFLVHRIVAETFLENPSSKKTVNHINGIKTDNTVNNLEWSTYSENAIHAHNLGLKCQKGTKNNRSKLSDEIVYKIKFETDKMLNHEIAKIYNIHPNHVGAIKRNEKWSHVVKKSSNQP